LPFFYVKQNDLENFMRKIAIFTTYLSLFVFSVVPGLAKASQCGFKPARPAACPEGDLICMCSPAGQCQWVFVVC
jgi:hypothetical protein